MDGEELDVKKFLINGEFVKVAVRLSGGWGTSPFAWRCGKSHPTGISERERVASAARFCYAGKNAQRIPETAGRSPAVSEVWKLLIFRYLDNYA